MSDWNNNPTSAAEQHPYLEPYHSDSEGNNPNRPASPTSLASSHSVDELFNQFDSILDKELHNSTIIHNESFDGAEFTTPTNNHEGSTNYSSPVTAIATAPGLTDEPYQTPAQVNKRRSIISNQLPNGNNGHISQPSIPASTIQRPQNKNQELLNTSTDESIHLLTSKLTSLIASTTASARKAIAPAKAIYTSSSNRPQSLQDQVLFLTQKYNSEQERFHSREEQLLKSVESLRQENRTLIEQQQRAAISGDSNAAAVIEQLNARIHSLEDSLQQFQQADAANQQLIAQLQGELTQLQGQYQAEQELRNSKKLEIEAKLRLLEEEKSTIINETAKIEAESESQRAQNVSLQEELQRVTSHLATAEAFIQQQQQQLQQLQQNVASTGSAGSNPPETQLIEQFQREISDLKAQLASSSANNQGEGIDEGQFGELLDERNELKKQLNELKQEIHFAAHNTGQQTALVQKDIEISRLQRFIEELQQQIKAQDSTQAPSQRNQEENEWGNANWGEESEQTQPSQQQTALPSEPNSPEQIQFSLQRTIQQLQGELKQREEENEALSATLLQVRTEREMKTEDIVQLQQEIHALREGGNPVNTSMSNEQLQALQSNFSQQEQHIQSLIQQLNDKDSVLFQLQQEIETLRSSASSGEASALASELAQLKFEFAAARSSLETINESTANKEAKMKGIIIKLRDVATEEKNARERKEQEITVLQEELKQLRAQNLPTEQFSGSESQQLSALQSQLHELSQENSDLQAKLEQIGSFDTILVERNQFGEQNLQLQQEIQQLQQQVSDQAVQLQLISAADSNHETAVNALQIEIDKLRVQMHSKIEQIDELSTELSAVKAERDTAVNNQNAGHTEHFELVQLQSEIQTLRAELQSQQELLNSSADRESKSSSQLSELIEQLMEKDSKIIELNDKVDFLEQANRNNEQQQFQGNNEQINQLQQQITDLTQQLQTVTSAAEAKQAKAKEMLVKLRDLAAEEKSAKETAQKEVEELRQQLEQLQSSQSSQSNSVDNSAEVEQLKQQLHDKQQEAEGIRAALQHAENHIANTEEIINNLQQQINNNSSNNTNESQGIIAQLQSELEQLKADLSTKQSLLDSNEASKSQQDTQLSDFVQQLMEKDDKITQLTEQLEASEQANQVQQQFNDHSNNDDNTSNNVEQINQLQQQITELSQQLQAVNSAADAKQAKAKEMLVKLRDLAAEEKLAKENANNEIQLLKQQIEQLQSAKAQEVASIGESNEDNSNQGGLKERINQLEATVDQLTNENNSNKLQAEELKNALQFAEAHIANADELIQNLQAQINNNANNTNNNNAQVDSSNSNTTAELQASIEQLRTDLSSRDAIIDSNEQSKTEQDQQLADFVQQLMEKDDKIAQLSEELETAQHNVNQQPQATSSSEQHINQLQQQITDLTQQLQGITVAAETKQGRAKEMLMKLRDMAAEEKAAKEAAQKEVENVQQQLAQLQVGQSFIRDDNQREVNELQSRLKELQSNAQQLNADLTSKEQRIEELSASLLSAQSTADSGQSTAEISALQSELASLRSSLQIKEELLNSSADRESKSSSQLSELIEQLMEKDSKIIELNDKVDFLEQANRNNEQQQFQGNNEQINQLQQQITDLTQQLQTVTSAAEAKQAKAKEMLVKLRDLAAEEKSAKETAQKEVEELRQQLEQLQSSQSSQSNSVDNSAEVEQLKQQLHDKQQEAEGIRAALQHAENHIANTEEIINNLQQQINNNSSNNTNESQGIIAQLQSELEQLKADLSTKQSLLDSNEASKSQQDTQLSDFVQQLMEKDDKITQLTEQLEASEQANQVQQQFNDHSNNDDNTSNNVEQINQLQQQITELSQQLQAVNSAADAKQAKAKEMLVKLRDLAAEEKLAKENANNEIQLLKQQIEQLQSAKAQEVASIGESNEDNSNQGGLKERINQLEATVDQLTNENNSNKLQAEELKNALQFAEAHIANADELIQNLQAQINNNANNTNNNNAQVDSSNSNTTAELQATIELLRAENLSRAQEIADLRVEPAKSFPSDSQASASVELMDLQDKLRDAEIEIVDLKATIEQLNMSSSQSRRNSGEQQQNSAELASKLAEIEQLSVQISLIQLERDDFASKLAAAAEENKIGEKKAADSDGWGSFGVEESSEVLSSIRNERDSLQVTVKQLQQQIEQLKSNSIDHSPAGAGVEDGGWDYFDTEQQKESKKKATQSKNDQFSAAAAADSAESQQRIEQLESELKGAKEDAESSRMESSTLYEQLKAAESARDEAVEQQSTMQNEIKSLLLSNDEEREQFEKQIQSLKQIIRESKHTELAENHAELEQLTVSLVQKQNEIDRLKQELSHHSVADFHVHNTSISGDENEAKLAKAKQIIVALRDSYNVEKEKANKLQAELDQLRGGDEASSTANVLDNSAEVVRLEAVLQEYKTKYEQAWAAQETLTSDGEQLELQLTQLKQQVQVLSQELLEARTAQQQQSAPSQPSQPRQLSPQLSVSELAIADIPSSLHLSVSAIQSVNIEEIKEISPAIEQPTNAAQTGQEAQPLQQQVAADQVPADQTDVAADNVEQVQQQQHLVDEAAAAAEQTALTAEQLVAILHDRDNKVAELIHHIEGWRSGHEQLEQQLIFHVERANAAEQHIQFLQSQQPSKLEEQPQQQQATPASSETSAQQSSRPHTPSAAAQLQSATGSPALQSQSSLAPELEPSPTPVTTQSDEHQLLQQRIAQLEAQLSHYQSHSAQLEEQLQNTNINLHSEVQNKNNELKQMQEELYQTRKELEESTEKQQQLHAQPSATAHSHTSIDTLELEKAHALQLAALLSQLEDLKIAIEEREKFITLQEERITALKTELKEPKAAAAATVNPILEEVRKKEAESTKKSAGAWLWGRGKKKNESKEGQEHLDDSLEWNGREWVKKQPEPSAIDLLPPLPGRPKKPQLSQSVDLAELAQKLGLGAVTSSTTALRTGAPTASTGAKVNESSAGADSALPPPRAAAARLQHRTVAARYAPSFADEFGADDSEAALPKSLLPELHAPTPAADFPQPAKVNLFVPKMPAPLAAAAEQTQPELADKETREAKASAALALDAASVELLAGRSVSAVIEELNQLRVQLEAEKQTAQQAQLVADQANYTIRQQQKALQEQQQIISAQSQPASASIHPDAAASSSAPQSAHNSPRHAAEASSESTGSAAAPSAVEGSVPAEEFSRIVAQLQAAEAHIAFQITQLQDQHQHILGRDAHIQELTAQIAALQAQHQEFQQKSALPASERSTASPTEEEKKVDEKAVEAPVDEDESNLLATIRKLRKELRDQGAVIEKQVRAIDQLKQHAEKIKTPSNASMGAVNFESLEDLEALRAAIRERDSKIHQLTAQITELHTHLATIRSDTHGRMEQLHAEISSLEVERAELLQTIATLKNSGPLDVSQLHTPAKSRRASMDESKLDNKQLMVLNKSVESPSASLNFSNANDLSFVRPMGMELTEWTTKLESKLETTLSQFQSIQQEFRQREDKLVQAINQFSESTSKSSALAAAAPSALSAGNEAGVTVIKADFNFGISRFFLICTMMLLVALFVATQYSSEFDHSHYHTNLSNYSRQLLGEDTMLAMLNQWRDIKAWIVEEVARVF
jgi:chromosome segregation ATPase